MSSIASILDGINEAFVYPNPIPERNILAWMSEAIIYYLTAAGYQEQAVLNDHITAIALSKVQQEFIDDVLRKNLRRRIPDVLNVLEAVNYIQKRNSIYYWVGMSASAAVNDGARTLSPGERREDIQNQDKLEDVLATSKHGLQRRSSLECDRPSSRHRKLMALHRDLASARFQTEESRRAWKQTAAKAKSFSRFYRYRPAAEEGDGSSEKIFFPFVLVKNTSNQQMYADNSRRIVSITSLGAFTYFNGIDLVHMIPTDWKMAKKRRRAKGLVDDDDFQAREK